MVGFQKNQIKTETEETKSIETNAGKAILNQDVDVCTSRLYHKVLSCCRAWTSHLSWWLQSPVPKLYLNLWHPPWDVCEAIQTHQVQKGDLRFRHHSPYICASTINKFYSSISVLSKPPRNMLGLKISVPKQYWHLPCNDSLMTRAQEIASYFICLKGIVILLNGVNLA